MPYCSSCGASVGDQDLFCAGCGARQPVAAPRQADGISRRTASALCYIPMLGWVPAIIALASQRFRQDKDVRFHAFQGIYLFVAWLLVDWVISPMRHINFGARPFPLWAGPGAWLSGALHLLLFFCWIFMLIKAAEGVRYRLPLFGELAERSVAEQK